MLKLASVLFFVALSTAKISKYESILYENENTLSPNPWEIKSDTRFKLEDKLWVLNLNDDVLDFRRLFLATKIEENIFERVTGPAIRNYKALNQRETYDLSNNEHEPISSEEMITNDDVTDIKNEILIIINKFLLNQLKDPDTYLLEEPSKLNRRFLKLYFKGPYTSLIFISGKSVYQYFINPPSPFPKWFLKEHENVIRGENGKYVEIPENVRYNFIKELLRSIRMYFSFPV